jgi:hypothetical protein
MNFTKYLSGVLAGVSARDVRATAVRELLNGGAKPDDLRQELTLAAIAAGVDPGTARNYASEALRDCGVRERGTHKRNRKAVFGARETAAAAVNLAGGDKRLARRILAAAIRSLR